MKILCIDLSTHAGYAIMEGEMGQPPKLLGHGTIHLGKGVVEYGPYPFNYVACSYDQINKITKLLEHEPDVIIVEETNGSRNRYTQKLLEFLHFQLIVDLDTYCRRKQGSKIIYLDTSQWRSNLGLKMTKEQKKANAKLSKAKREAEAKGAKVDKKALGVKGKVTAKHMAVAWANETYGLELRMKDNDAADAIALGAAFFNGAQHCDGT